MCKADGVKRYMPTGIDCMSVRANGAYVTYRDYVLLRDQLEALRKDPLGLNKERQYFAENVKRTVELTRRAEPPVIEKLTWVGKVDKRGFEIYHCVETPAYEIVFDLKGHRFYDRGICVWQVDGFSSLAATEAVGTYHSSGRVIPSIIVRNPTAVMYLS